MDNNETTVSMNVDTEAGTITFTVVPAENTLLLAEFLASGLDYVQGQGESDGVSH